MGDKPIGTRAHMFREVAVQVDLGDGELPDMQKRFGTAVFAPRSVKLRFYSSAGGAWSVGSPVVRGPMRLKAGGLSTEKQHETQFSSYGHDRGEWPDWLTAMVARHWPAPVAGDDLPIVADAADLDA